MSKIARIAGAPANKRAGVMLHVHPGSKISKNSTLFEIHADNERKLDASIKFAKSNEAISMKRIILEKFS